MSAAGSAHFFKPAELQQDGHDMTWYGHGTVCPLIKVWTFKTLQVIKYFLK